MTFLTVCRLFYRRNSHVYSRRLRGNVPDILAKARNDLLRLGIGLLAFLVH